MASRITTRLAALGALAIGLTGMAATAKADIGFTNISDTTLVFNLQCPASSVDTWRIRPGASLNVYCTNGAAGAFISITTTHRDGRRYTVRGTVYDGRTYALGHDGDGDVSFQRVTYPRYY